jgi:hypothetical protein
MNLFALPIYFLYLLLFCNKKSSSFAQENSTTSIKAVSINFDNDGKVILPSENPFDWIMYLEGFSGGGKTRESALNHHDKHGNKQRAHHVIAPRMFPPFDTLQLPLKKLYAFVASLDERKIPKSRRTFISYYVSPVESKSSTEVVMNNELIFNSSMSYDSSPQSTNFYWIHSVFSSESNVKQFLHPFSWNSVVVESPWHVKEQLSHNRVLQLLNNYLVKHFGSVFFLNNEVRGPLIQYATPSVPSYVLALSSSVASSPPLPVVSTSTSHWLDEFRSLLFHPNENIGIVGSLLVCESSGSYIKTNAYLLKTDLIPSILDAFEALDNIDSYHAYSRKYPLFLSSLIRSKGYNISSLLYSKRLNVTAFNGHCLVHPDQVKDHRLADPSKWCDITPDEVIFFEYGGDLLKLPGVLCEDILEMMKFHLIQYSSDFNRFNTKQLHIPETIYSGIRYQLYHQYEKEIFADYLYGFNFLPSPDSEDSSTTGSSSLVSPLSFKTTTSVPHSYLRSLSPVPKENKNKICFLVRTAKMHGNKHNSGPMVESVTNGGIDDIAQCEFCFSYVWLSFSCLPFFLLSYPFLPFFLFCLYGSIVTSNRSELGSTLFYYG